MLDKDEVLAQKCIETGEKAERYEGISQHTMAHEAGLVIVYKNGSKTRDLVETLELELNDTKVVGYEDCKGTIELHLKVGEQKMFHIVPTVYNAEGFQSVE